MATIIPFLKDGVFDSKDLQAMSMALDDACKALSISPDATATREIIAVRIIELARRGERSPTRLRDRILKDSERNLGGANSLARSPGL